MESDSVNPPATSILQLPDDCLYFIFQRLESCSDRESFGLTCHRWLDIQSSSRRSLQFECSLTHLNLNSPSKPSIKINSFHLDILLARFQHLESLSLSGCTLLQDSALSTLDKHGLKLQALNLDCCFAITDRGISFIASGCPFLEKISLYRCNITNDGLATLSESCSGLQHVNLSHCLLISDNGIRALTQNCRNLMALNVSRCSAIKGIGFQECSPSLTFLEAYACNFDHEGVPSIFSGGGLEYLNVSNLSWCIKGHHGFESIEPGLLAKLRILDFRMCRTIGNDAIVRIAAGCPLLQEWNLGLCHEVRIEGWRSIGSNCNNLERLHVHRCRNFCDEGLRAVRDGCKRLRKLYMSGCARITESAVEMFKCSRTDVDIVVEEQVLCIAPYWPF